MCGGTGSTIGAAGEANGLSPRVRGNPANQVRPGHRARSIPACAGEPYALPDSLAAAQVYPRVCGGTISQPQPERTKWGLSPRVRGNHGADLPGADGARSIPACAGEPPTRDEPGGSAQVYPRVCGGTAVRQRIHRDGQGLSPRVRGNPVGVPVGVPVGGSIPACAGEPLTGVLASTIATVYPRVCGGTPSCTFDQV